MTEILRSTGANVSSSIQLLPVGRAVVQVAGLAFQPGNQTGPMVRIRGRASTSREMIDIATILPGNTPLVALDLPPEWQCDIVNNLGGAEIIVDVAGIAAPVMDASLSRVVPITPGAGSDISPGRMWSVNCTSAGDVTIRFANGSTHIVPVMEGYSRFPDAIVAIPASTATGAFAVFY